MGPAPAGWGQVPAPPSEGGRLDKLPHVSVADVVSDSGGTPGTGFWWGPIAGQSRPQNTVGPRRTSVLSPRGAKQGQVTRVQGTVMEAGLLAVSRQKP